MIKWIKKLVFPAAAAVTFTGQITSKDIQAYPGYQTLPNVEKAKFLGNSLSSHLTGFSPYPKYGTPGITFNAMGWANKYTFGGLIGVVVSQIIPAKYGKKVIQDASYGALVGGVVGGLLDPGSGTRSGGSTVRGLSGGRSAIGAHAGAGAANGAYMGANTGY